MFSKTNQFTPNKKAILLPFFVCASLFWSLTYLLDLDGPYLTDFIVCLLFAYILAAVLKDNVFYVFNVLFMLVVLYVINKLKTQYLGTPVQASDILSIIALYDIQTHLVQLVSVVIVSLLLSMFVLNVRYTRRTLLTVLGLLSLAPVGYLYAYTINDCEGADDICMSSYAKEHSSSVAQFSVSLIQLFDELFTHPSNTEVIAAQKEFGDEIFTLTQAFPNKIEHKRNVYFILIESLFDPTSIKDQGYSRDPFYAKFRELWEQTGESLALSPVFGGGTANPEFELLCGIPITSSVIKFELPVLNSNLPCLPALLHNNGYTSVANHPNIRGFWNRDAAYPKLGFEKYYSIDDFEKDEIISGSYLSDRSLYRQAYQHTSGLNTPVFNYVLTASEHYPYAPLPDKENFVHITSDNDYLSRYANLVYKGTDDVYQYYKNIVLNDPDAIIVILGDHLPMLGKDFVPYRESGFFNGVNDTEPQNIINKHAVPLIISDGKRGALKIGTVSIYQIPFIVMKLLASPGSTLVDAPYRDGWHGWKFRPLAGNGVLFENNHKWEYCNLDSHRNSCRKPLAWFKATRVLDKDITVGEKLSANNSSLARN